MKKNILKIYLIIIISGLSFFNFSCVKDLLDQQHTTEVSSDVFWKTEEDATIALMGAYRAIRPTFSRDYHHDGFGEFLRMYNTGVASMSFSTSNPSNYGGGLDNIWKYLYMGVNRTNYVIDNVRKMLPAAKTPESLANLEAVIGEARLLRGMCYFRLIAMYGDVPYIGNIVYDNSEVASISRTPIAEVKDSIYADFTYAAEKLPSKASAIGRAAKPAALAFRGKLNLYWACWNKFGWPELDTFTPSESEAEAAYAAAANDFRSVIDDFGLRLFRNGEPGQWGTMGDASVLPNYYYMFIPSTGNSNEDGEMLMVFAHGGPETGQGEDLMRVFTGRSVDGSQNQAVPRYEILDRYQSTITGDFCDPLIPMNPATPGARTALNSAINPESFANRDYRMKATLLWDYEKIMGMASLKETGYVVFIYKTWGGKVVIDGVEYPTFNDAGTNRTGVNFRKYVRNYGGAARNQGDYNYPVMRLADVYLMYAEATNAIYGPQDYAIEMVNRVRHRGNLPPLSAEKTATKESFFDAIEQERIIELFAEGHRNWDLRRWRALERVWGPPYGDGKWTIDTHGANQQRFFYNASELTYERCYLFRIPPSERDRNSNLTQNKPWR